MQIRLILTKLSFKYLNQYVKLNRTLLAWSLGVLFLNYPSVHPVSKMAIITKNRHFL